MIKSVTSDFSCKMALLILILGMKFTGALAEGIEDPPCTSTMTWIYLPPGVTMDGCTSNTNCCTNTICYGLQYTPANTGILQDYTTGFFAPCFGGASPVVYNASCSMADKSSIINGCATDNLVLFNSSGNTGSIMVTACQPVVLHQVCFQLMIDSSFTIMEDVITDLTTTIEIDSLNSISEAPDFIPTTVTRSGPVEPMDQSSTVSCLVLAIAPTLPVVMDQCGTVVTAMLTSTVDTPNPLTCEGTRVYTYTYTDCSGFMFDWLYTYTIERNDFTVPADGSGTVSCPAQATSGTVMLPTVMSDCSETLTPTGPVTNPDGTDTYNGCEGTISYRWTYTDCEGNTHPWTYTYTVDYSGGLTAPANGSSTVPCPALAVDPGAPPAIMDACGRSVTAVLVGSTPQPACEGTVVWTYRYTACDLTTTADWTYTYTIDYSGALTPPANGSSTVSCPVQAVDPGPPANIMDACGRTVVPILIGSVSTPTMLTCEGTVVWTYRYTACDGITTEDWTYTYTIDYSGGLTPPANGSLTVPCPAQAVNPGPPANILDACGRTVSPVLVGSVSTPPVLTCEGTIVWTYRYTACDGTTTADWTYTYTVDYSGALTPPVNGSSTVACPAQAVNPGPPANITDACGRTVSPVLVGSVSTPPVLTCEGTVVWTYRYTACDGTTTADWTYTYTVDYSGALTPPLNGSSTVACPAQAVNPGPPANITDACGRTVSPVLVGSVSTPPVLTCEGTVVWTYRYTACDGTTTADWTYTYTVDYSGALAPPLNGSSTVSCPAQAVNPGPPANILDACGRTVSPVLVGSVSTPPAFTCEGTVVWTYRYTACDGTTTADWTYTYTVDYSGALTPPANGSSTVSCPAQAVNPGPPANILDACGRTVIPLLVGSVSTPPVLTCEGTVVWTYRYTACDGTTTADWTYTYTVDYSGGLTPPANGAMTVSCPFQAVNPGPPPPITDACGRTVNAVLVGSTPPPLCEGTVVWTFRYTACDGTTTADVTYTYTINYTGGLIPPPNGGSTVSCPAQAVDPGTPAPIQDACGRIVTAVLIGSSTPPACEGSVVWTYRYTDCDGTTTADWTYTYTIDYSGGLTVPTNGSSTVSCPAQAINPGPPANILDACGRTVVPVLVGSVSTPPALTCEGTVVWTYRYTACDGTTTVDWTYTYTVDYSGALTAPANGSSTVSCPAQAVNPGPPANILDACGRTVVPVLVGSVSTPPAFTCEGTVVWTYRYTACDGITTADWTYTYTVDYSGGLTPPANGSLTVTCPAQAVDPGAPANITDACGRSVVPVLIGSVSTPTMLTCEGTVVWSYRYTACDGTTTADWTYTFTVDYSGGLTAPPNGSSTVSCPAQAVNPGPPANILDACGRTVSPVLVGSVSTPPALTCEGTIVWTYRYTACDGTTTADWTYTYTIEYEPFVIITPDGSQMVNCPALANTPPVGPTVFDNCGNVLAGVVTSTPPLTCEGTRTFTFTYTDCEGNSDAWNFSTTVDVLPPVVPAPGSATVECPDETDEVPVPPMVPDPCFGGFFTPSAPVVTAKPICEGMRTYTFRYTNCAGEFADWVFTYTVDRVTAPFEDGGPVQADSTIECYLDAVAPTTLPSILDVCGTPLVPTGPIVGGTNTGGCDGTITYTYTYTDCAGLQTPWVYTYIIDCDPLVLHVWLEGPYSTSGDSMSTKMNQLHTLPGQNAPPFYIDYPAGQPYSGAPWNYNGNPGTQWGDFLGQTPYPADVVDWVLVMIRKNGTLPVHTIWTCAGWVHKDGLVTFPENCTLPAFSTSDMYYFVVQHRNHLGILSPAETDMPCGAAQLEWDFRNSNSYAPIFRFGQKQLEVGVWGMFNGNGEQITSITAINSADRTLWRDLQGVLGYSLGDFELDTDTDSADENAWKNNQNKTTGVVFY